MGAAIEVFEGSAAIEVGRDRFVPVKTTNDLLVLRSDVYDLGERLRARPGRRRRCRSSTSTATTTSWSASSTSGSPRARRRCARRTSLRVEGDWTFGHGVQVVGDVDARTAASARAGARRTPCSRSMPRCLTGPRLVRRGAPRPDPRRDRAAAGRPSMPLMEALGLPVAEDVRPPIVAAALRQLRRWTGTPSSADVADRVRDARCTCRSSARSAPARPSCSRARAGHRRQDHDRGAGARGRRRGGALRVDRPRRRPGADRPGAGARASTSGPPARTSRRATSCSPARHRARPAPPRAARRRRPRPTVPSRPRPRVVVLSTGSELREPGHAARPRLRSTTATPTCSPPRRARAGAIAYRRRHRARRARRRSSTRCSDQLVRADLVVTSGGVSQGDYDVVKEALRPLGTVWFGGVAMQPGKPQGFGVVGEDGRRSSRCRATRCRAYISFEMFVLPALRKMMGRAPTRRPRPARG